MSQTATSDLDFGKTQVVTARQLHESGYPLSEKALETQGCPFCGKELSLLCVCGGLAGCIVTREYEPCSCPKAKAQAERDRQAALQRLKDEKLQRAADKIKRRMERAFRQSEMPVRWKRYTFAAFETPTEETRQAKTRCLNFARWFCAAYDSKQIENRSPNGLLIVGNSGTGKTHLAAAVLNEIIAAYISAECVPPAIVGSTMGDMLLRLRETYAATDKGSEESILRTYTEVPLLLIDDFGSEQMTDWAAARIFTIINARYNESKPTIITSNYASDTGLAQRLTPKGQPVAAGAKIADRLAEMCSRIELNGKSHRSGVRIDADTAEANKNTPNSRFQSSGDRLEGQNETRLKIEI